MKLKMKALLLIFLTIVVVKKASAQRIISLREYSRLADIYNKAEDTDGLDDLDDVTYVKDVNNELDKFVGRWNGSLNGRTYTIDVIKKVNTNFFKTPPSRDFLIVYLTIKDASGNIIYSNTDRSERAISFQGINFQPNTNIYRLNFSGNCDKDAGQANFYFAADGRLTLTYGRIDDIFAKGDCESVLPPKILLTKVLSED